MPLEDASRFGLLVTDDEDRVIAFQEKPENPRSTLASMGVYIFDKNLLVDTLEVGESSVERTMLDFGKDIIPIMIERGDVFAYAFDGYWQDVGTLQSYWEANLALLDDLPKLNLYDPDWVIHTRSEERPPAKIMEGSHVSRSLVSNGCIIIRGTVEHSVLSPGVVVHDGAIVRDSVIMGDTRDRGGGDRRALHHRQAGINRCGLPPRLRRGYPNMLDPRAREYRHHPRRQERPHPGACDNREERDHRARGAGARVHRPLDPERRDGRFSDAILGLAKARKC